jgi:hypothetical protein
MPIMMATTPGRSAPFPTALEYRVNLRSVPWNAVHAVAAAVAADTRAVHRSICTRRGQKPNQPFVVLMVD